MHNKILFSILILTILTVPTFVSVFADPGNGYEAYYFSSIRTTTTKVLFACEFTQCSLTNLPPPSGPGYIGAILSVNGGDAFVGPSRFTYQSFYTIDNTGSIRWSPQITDPLDPNDGTWWIQSVTGVGTKTYPWFYGKISIVGSTAVFKSYAYSNSYAVEHDLPTILTQTCATLPTTYTRLFEGSESINVPNDNPDLGTKTTQLLQSGTESTFNCTNYNIHTAATAYDYAGWKYAIGKTTNGKQAINAYDNSHFFTIGGKKMRGQYSPSGTDYAYWIYSSNLFSSFGTTIWTPGGTATQLVASPYS